MPNITVDIDSIYYNLLYYLKKMHTDYDGLTQIKSVKISRIRFNPCANGGNVRAVEERVSTLEKVLEEFIIHTDRLKREFEDFKDEIGKDK